MWRRLVITLVFGWPATAHADWVCAEIENGAERQACYSRAGETGAEVVIGAPKDPGAKPQDDAADARPATTKEIVQTLSPSSYKTVDPADIAVAPRKFTGKPIQVKNAKCFHADQDEFRCLLPGSSVVMVLSRKISPAPARSAIEDDCGAIKTAMSSSKCRKTIRFVPLDSSQDLLNGYTRRVVVVTSTIDITEPEARRR